MASVVPVANPVTLDVVGASVVKLTAGVVVLLREVV
jgi:hypothetical protein